MQAAKLALLALALIAGPAFSQPTGPPISVGGGSSDPLTVLGPAAACVDNQLARWDGASNTALQCSALTVSDTTGDITAPGALTISTAAVDSANVTISTGGGVATPGNILLITGNGTGSSGGQVIIDPGGPNRMPTWNKSALIVANIFVKDGTDLYRSDGWSYSDIDTPDVSITSEYIAMKSGNFYSISGSNNSDNELFARLYVDSDSAWAARNGAVAQTFRLYGTYTDASNYERLALSGVAGTSVNISAETAGTGADNLDLILKPAGTGQFYIGAGGTTAAAPASVVVNATGGSGTDIAGASLTLAGGKGTGNAAGGNVLIQTSDPGSTGTTLQTLATRITVGVARTTIANILSLTGISAAPGSPAAGDIVYDSVNNLFCGYNGSAWVSFSGAGTCWAE